MITQILFKVADKAWLMEGILTSYLLSYKFPFLYGPLVLLFTRQAIYQSNKCSWKDAFHFLPFLYSVVALNLANHQALFTPLFWPMKAAPAFGLQLVSLVAYHTIALRMCAGYKKGNQSHLSAVHSFRVQWLNLLIRYSFIICLAISLLTYLIYTWYPAHNWLRFGFVLLCFFIYWISYSALQKPALFMAFVDEEGMLKEKPVYTLPSLMVHRPAKKYANSTLTDEAAAKIISSLVMLMQEQKPYRDPELSIEQLSTLLQTNRYVLSQVLNERLGQSYYGYINGLRWMPQSRCWPIVPLRITRSPQSAMSLALIRSLHSTRCLKKPPVIPHHNTKRGLPVYGNNSGFRGDSYSGFAGLVGTQPFSL